MNKRKHNLKILTLPTWCLYEFEESDCPWYSYRPMDPIFNRDGWYYDREIDIRWYEVEYNNKFYAFAEKDSEMFLHCLDTASHVPLSTVEINAIKTLMLYSNRNKRAFRDLLYIDDHCKTLREIGRNGYKAYQRFEEFKQARNIK